MNVLHIIYVYQRLKSDAQFKSNYHPHSFIFGAKAAPSYTMAKYVIELIDTISEIMNNDPETRDLLKVVFVRNYNVSYAEYIMPAADLSEQISTATKEASGTGNMKFMMNGALTIGTLDGANIEIREEVGEENFFVFGLTAEQVEIQSRNYNPEAIISEDRDLSCVIKLLQSGHFNLYEPGIFDPILNSITSPHDPWMVAADFRSFVAAQQQVADAYQDRERWVRMSILNTACSGKFSTDRTIKQYNEDIWHLKPLPVGSPE